MGIARVGSIIKRDICNLSSPYIRFRANLCNLRISQDIFYVQMKD